MKYISNWHTYFFFFNVFSFFRFFVLFVCAAPFVALVLCARASPKGANFLRLYGVSPDALPLVAIVGPTGA